MAWNGKDRLRVLFIIGTRPEAIKMLPLVLAFRDSEAFDPVVISTGQHEELVREVLAIGDVVPDITWDMPPGPRTLNELFAFVLTSAQKTLAAYFGDARRPHDAEHSAGYPAICFVHGDTTSAAAAALAAFHIHLPVGHVEAGLRTSSILSPFPEELNRQLISRIAAIHFAPTLRNKANLTREGIDFGRVLVTGNTAIDALHLAAERAQDFDDPRLADLNGAHPPKIVTVTAHRRENWGEPLARIADAVGILAESHPDVRFVVALHPNPAVADVLRDRLESLSNVSLVASMGYTAFARLLARSTLAITDSGGIQEEAPAFGTPVICVRESTERQEGVEAGTVQLVGTDTTRIVEAAALLLDDEAEHAKHAARANPYGDGQASARILQSLEHLVFGRTPPHPFGPGYDRQAVLAAADSIDPLTMEWAVDAAPDDEVDGGWGGAL
ncbi:non-hydrolyzing UDP-N-acetylglucosamine 2-epimerase [Streptomyces sp. AC495_CC817]|uniref:non-hydrolyzing UDP-N-acetylglucosamine 2-epimerase n=1 Tax=Streptomyces sp. AC495_CC817 TaxID=2823900 RepID=UPI001C255232|nr:UDP-N-acetylglucosamine 2-epimerase (non-hydrolyzing) [Streptomyces sp. AC495_CC817]